MDQNKERNRKVNPRQDSNIFSKFFFWYTSPLFIEGFKRELEEEDLYAALSDYKSQKLGARFEKEWTKSKKIHLVLWNLTGKHYLLLGLTKITTIFLNVLRPLVISKFVSYFVPGQTELTKVDACLYSFLLIGLSLTETFYRQNYYMMVETLAIKLRASLGSVIFKKTLYSSVHSSNFGKITNVVTRDVSTFDFFFTIFNDSWTEFISMVIICYTMYQKIGLAVLVVVLSLGILIPGLVLVAIKMAVLKTATCQKTDERIDTLRDVLCKIRTAKMYVWETFAEKRVSDARRKEMKILFDMCVSMFFVLSLSMLTLHLTHYFVLMTCVWLGQTLTAETIYFVTSGFHSMYYNLTVAIPYATFTAAQVAAAIKRIQSVVEMLDTEDNRIVAKNVTLIGKGLTLVLGHASSGKSVFLLTLLKEFGVTGARISYVSQEPWLFPSTIRQNILFGAKYDAERYHKVIEMCALDYDFRLFEKGDGTIVAEEGINLSKGQQSRICMARAIYRESDIYLFDDCLANLDPLVSNTIFKNLMSYLRGKVVILVTSNSRFVPYATYLIKLTNGEAEFTQKDTPVCVLKSESMDYCNAEEEENINKVYRETKQSGAVPLRIYLNYIKHGGGTFPVAVIFCLFLLGQVVISYKEKLISQWASLQDGKMGYMAVICAIAFLILLRAFSLFFFLRKASISLHKSMLKCVINASMKFFDHTFMGNIVNRFSKDLVTTDETIPFTMLHLTAGMGFIGDIFKIGRVCVRPPLIYRLLKISFETMGVLFLISSVNATFLLPILIFFASLFLLRNFYLRTGRALRRLEATTKSPIVGYLNAALRGLPTIKTFQAQDILIEEFHRHQDLHTSASYSNLSCMRAFVFAVDTLTSLFLAFVILKFLFFDKGANAGEVGLAVSQTLMMSATLFYGFHKWAELETQMTSAERAFEYTRIGQESKTGLVLAKWPILGEVRFDNVFLSFDNSKSYVLNNLTFCVKPGEKVAIVGRTGAGKSSIISALFRLYEYEGGIFIDGVDIKTLALSFLRSKISVIPQDPLVFNGTFLDNIDPERKHCDIKLKDVFPNLDTYITENELSFAQKQLICVARVLLRKNQILLLDEITEDGDSNTESLINDLVEEHFGLSTVIRVTHKMKFAMKCDRVLVLDKGRVVEFDSPWSLLNDKSSLFSKMVDKSDFNVKQLL